MTDVDVAKLQARVAKLERTVTFLLEKLNMTYEDNPGSTVSAAVRGLLDQGNKIGAIQQYREETGAGLLEAKQLIDSLSK
jgi:ribosomal protein L7/L12